MKIFSTFSTVMILASAFHATAATAHPPCENDLFGNKVLLEKALETVPENPFFKRIASLSVKFDGSNGNPFSSVTVVYENGESRVVHLRQQCNEIIVIDK